MSIGYDPVQKSYETDKDGQTTRRLKEVALWEGSLVTFPMNPKARVTGVKSWDGIAGDLRALAAEIKGGTFDATKMQALEAAFGSLGSAIEQITALLSLADTTDAGKGAAIEPPRRRAQPTSRSM